jgi:hypothetical protein
MNAMDAEILPPDSPHPEEPKRRKKYPYTYQVPSFFPLRQILAVQARGIATRRRLRLIAAGQGLSIVVALLAIIFSFDGNRLFGTYLLVLELILFIFIPLPGYLVLGRDLAKTDPRGSLIEAAYGPQRFFLRRGDLVRGWSYDDIESIDDYFGFVIVGIRDANGAAVTMPRALCPNRELDALRSKSAEGLSRLGSDQ